ncbi:MAG: S9 family peptidase [Labilithrix sp.]|nr:S9 family peptidase [Labilithrix sp.]
MKSTPLVGRAAAALVVLAACAPGAHRAPRAHGPRGAPASDADLAAAPAAAPRARTLPVPAPVRPAVHSYFGTSVTDDYEWLEDGQAAEVKAFTDAQNALTRATLDALPERAAVHARVTSLLGSTSPDWFAARYDGGRVFALKSAPPKQQAVLVDLGPASAGRAPDVANERVIVDPNALDPSGKTTIDFFAPSPDGRLVAVSLSKDGTESGDVHLFEVATGKPRNETIARVNGGTAGGSVAWNSDGTGFHYTRYPRAGERPAADLDFYQQVWFHKLGTPEAADVYAVGKDFPRIAETELTRSVDGKRLLAHVSNGDGGDVEHHVFEGGRWHRLTRFADQVPTAVFGPDGKVYAVSRSGAPRGRVIAFAPPFDRAPAPADVLGEGDAVIEDLLVTKSAIYVVEIVDGPSRVRRFPLGAKPEPLAREPKVTKPVKPVKGAKKRTPPAPPPAPPPTIAAGERGHAAAVLPLPPVSSVTRALEVGDDLLLRVESFVEPPRWLLYRASEHRLVPTTLAKKAAYDMSDVEVVRESCVSSDGTKVPMSILRKRGAKLDGSLPAYLTGYGGFGVTLKPRMRATYRVWLESGGVVAEANLRGGGERGESWHRAGNLTNKQNVFDDFAACARTLFDRAYTTPERLAISGRSNGGLLMGASLVQHPEMFRAVAAAVGIYDMLRTELSPNGAFNVTEYGSVSDEAEFRALFAYSPLHNVKNAAYPAVLFTTGANDPRVDPYHSRKMTARLQAATSSDRPILLRASGDVGHGMGTPLAAEVEEMTDMLAFLLHEVGASLPPASN